MRYPDFEQAIRLCIQAGPKCSLSKSDMSSAFRHVPLRKDQWYLMVMKVKHPVTKKIYYFVDKCLPFGSSISCAIFQEVSNAIAFIVTFKSGKVNINYLDDFLFVAMMKVQCDEQMAIFLWVCQMIDFPVALEKTSWGCTILIFLGLLLDTEKQIVCIPIEKTNKTLNLIEFFLNKRNKKVTVLDFQKLCGSLNFLCRCITPGRAFLRRLYLKTDKLKQHHHVRVTAENRLDLLTWKFFLENSTVYCRKFIMPQILNADILDMYSDASRNFMLGFGAYCGSEWSWGQWDTEFCSVVQPSIEYLELYAVTVAVLNWLKLFENRKIVLFCDNEAVVNMINNTSSTCRNCMVLIRIIMLESLVRNTHVFAKYISSRANSKANALSRLQFN